MTAPTSETPASGTPAAETHAAVRRSPFEFEVRSDERIRGDLWTPSKSENGTAIVVCHGFKGFKDWGFFPYLAERLAADTGHRTVTFNFTGSGIGADLETFTELESFGRNTFSRELEDLEAVLDRLAAGVIGDVHLPPAARYGLLGHSRGGATALLKASLRSQVCALVTWAAIASVERYELGFAEQFATRDVVYITNARTGQQMPLYANVLDDLRANRDRLQLIAAAGRLQRPYLIIHGTEDESVPPADAEALAHATGTAARLELIEGAGHTMGAVHPFAGTTAALERAISLSADHFRDHMERRG